MGRENVLVIGSGGREHALAWKLKQSPNVNNVFLVPACLHSLTYSDTKPDLAGNIPSGLGDIQPVLQFCRDNSIELVVIGPDQPVCDGWGDVLSASLPTGVAVFGPSRAAARLEGSKAYAKEFFSVNAIPTADYHTVSSFEEAIEVVERNTSWSKYVLKEDGLCAGKGVFIAETQQEAIAHLRQSTRSPASGGNLVMEEFLDGYELSAMCFVDGNTIRRLPLSQDHKQIDEGARGANTGGMGAIAPVVVEPAIDEQIDWILQTTVSAMKRQGTPYKGLLYAGLMVDKRGKVKVLEYNCRFGDPETQPLMRLLESDLYAIMVACCRGALHELPEIKWSSRKCVGIVMATKGYPASGLPTGLPIENLPSDGEDDGGSVVVFHAGARLDGNRLVNSGGRVLCVTALGHSLFEAKGHCLSVLEAIRFDAKHYRRDIGDQWMLPRVPLSYASSGVDVEEGNRFVDNIKSICRRTAIPGTEQIGGFGATIDLAKVLCDGDPSVELIVGMDGVGTKIEVASKAGRLEHIGWDLVAMCVNDVLCHFARPVAFLDYYVTGKLDRAHATEVVKSIASACQEAGCALVGGETAEMPGVYAPTQWDLAGCCIGLKERGDAACAMGDVAAGDLLIGLESNGLHSNGFSLVRKITDSLPPHSRCPWDDNSPLVDELLKPTRIYTAALLPMAKSGLVKAMAHITGGGLVDNVPRALPRGLTAEIDCSAWDPQPVFHWLHQWGPVPLGEMLKTFNCGIGMVLVVGRESVAKVSAILKSSGFANHTIGEVMKSGERQVRVKFLNEGKLFRYSFDREFIARPRAIVAILISGTGTNMVRLIEQSQRLGSHAHVRVVISNRADAKGITLARSMGVETLVVPHSGKTRQQFEVSVSHALEERGVELICLAGFMRILSAEFVQRWRRRVINVHPSLLPAFRGMDAVKSALEAGVKVTGCTVHSAVEEVDAGQILAQATVRVESDDNEHSLHKKIQQEEHRTYPAAMESEAKRMVAARILA